MVGWVDSSRVLRHFAFLPKKSPVADDGVDPVSIAALALVPKASPRDSFSAYDIKNECIG